MKLQQYFFGYLFVRFAKALALLALLATAVVLCDTVYDYSVSVTQARYRGSDTLGMQLKQLEEELAFAKDEVSRLAAVGDLPPIELSERPVSSAGFDRVLEKLRGADARRAELKSRLTADFEGKANALRARVRSVIDEIESARAAANSKPQTSAPAAAPARPQPSSAPIAARTIFEGGGLNAKHGTLEKVGEFLDLLGRRAEKDENQRLIREAKAALNDLARWLPSETPRSLLAASASRDDESEPASADDPQQPRPDPLTTARKTYDNIGFVIEAVRSEIHRNWRLDSILLETTRDAENEAGRCRNAEAAVQKIRVSHGRSFMIRLAIGAMAAFLVLVFADFIQSFFDTASNSAAILRRLDDGQPARETMIL